MIRVSVIEVLQYHMLHFSQSIRAIFIRLEMVAGFSLEWGNKTVTSTPPNQLLLWHDNWGSKVTLNTSLCYMSLFFGLEDQQRGKWETTAAERPGHGRGALILLTSELC